MNSIRSLIAIPSLKDNLKFISIIGLLLPLLLAACSPLEVTETSPDGSSPTIETSETPALENPQSPTSAPEEQKFSPHYLPLTTKPDIPPQTIDGVTAGYNVSYDGSAASVTLTIPWLMGSVPEVVEQERVDRANQRLAGSGIEFVYLILGHGAKVEITRRLEGMADEKIHPLIREALSEQYEGPWVFTVAVRQ